jgi:hypothetical protein
MKQSITSITSYIKTTKILNMINIIAVKRKRALSSSFNVIFNDNLQKIKMLQS